jgi:hypothetical protein
MATTHNINFLGTAQEKNRSMQVVSSIETYFLAKPQPRVADLVASVMPTNFYICSRRNQLLTPSLRVARFLLVKTYQNGKNLPNGHKLY